jgi:tetratricopeptide (TPR) repeat protein
MKKQIPTLFLLVASLISAQTAPNAQSPAEKAIAAAEAAIAADSKRPDSLNALAMAYARRARETADPGYYNKGDEVLQKCFALQPENFDCMKTKTWLLLGQHKFAAAREVAARLNKKMPDDILVYGFLADANVELGDYKAAENAAQWMLDMRPGNVPGLTRGAYLRELFGDIDGAIDFMNQAYRRVRPEETEDRAWMITHVAHLQLAKGDAAAAERMLTQALALYPNYHYALGNLAKAKMAQGDVASAVELFRKRYQLARHPENLYDVGIALARAGRSSEARTTFAAFEIAARAEMESSDNSNRELIFYYLDHSANPAEGLRIARREVEQRQDVFTLDAYAWSLFRNSKHAEARKQIERALAVGIRDAQFFYHAAAIASKLQDPAAAVKYARQSLSVNPLSTVAAEAKSLLSTLEPQVVLQSSGELGGR